MISSNMPLLTPKSFEPDSQFDFLGQEDVKGGYSELLCPGSYYNSFNMNKTKETLIHCGKKGCREANNDDGPIPGVRSLQKDCLESEQMHLL